MSEGTRGVVESVSLGVNGASIVVDVPGDLRLVTFLRERLGLPGTKLGCEVGVCGVCTVLVDGRPTSSCLTLVAQVDGSEVLTIEGAAEREELEGLLDAFMSEGGFQCGFCTPGQIMTVAALMLNEDAATMTDAERRHWMAGTLCRCTGYYGIDRAACKALG